MDQKSQAAKDAGYEINVLYKDDLQSEFEWVKNNYQYKNIEELYDEYKPKYTYICNQCAISFSSEKEKKTLNTFCSQSCCGKFRADLKHKS